MKYKLTKNKRTVNGIELTQIQAIKDFSTIKAGDLGGWLESEKNLVQSGNAWVADNAQVFGNARVSGDLNV